MSESTSLPLNPDHHDDGGAVSTMVRPSRPRLDKLPPWKVLLHNDDHNDIEFVVNTILMLTPLNEQDAKLRMLEAHQEGIALLLATHQEHAELLQEQFTSRGLTVTIEPDEG